MKWNVWVTTVRLILLAGALASSVTACSKREKVSAKSLAKGNSNSSAGSAFTISLPATNPFSSADSNVQLKGTCVTGSTVELSGPASETLACQNGIFAFLVSQTTDGTYTYTLTQTVTEANTTTTKSFQWIRNTSLPPTPVITTPLVNPVYSNTNMMMLEGSCVAGNQVQVSGDLSATTNCSSLGRFTAMVATTTDNTYQLDVKQKNPLGVFSAAATIVWQRDTVAPGALVLVSPTGDPIQNSLSTLSLNGTCEDGAMVNLSGDLTGTTLCSGGNFTLPVSASTDGTYVLGLKQTDLAGNSSAELTRTWIRSTTVPSAPVITSPIAQPHLTNQNSVLVQGTCDTGNQVIYSGASNGTVNCNSGTFTAGLSGSTDGLRTYSFIQKNSAGLNSPATSFSWERDTVAPQAVVIVGPGVSPYTTSGNSVILSGSCETGAAVQISGDFTSSTPCATGQFSFTLSGTTDATRTYTLKQVDAAANPSASVSWSWIRNSSVPETPSLSVPLHNPHYSNQTSVQLSGTCVSGNTVRVEGGNGVEGTTTCAQNSFTLNVTRPDDGTFNFDLYQRSTTGIDSSNLAFEWTLDRVAPTIPTLNSPATSPFTSNGNSVVVAGDCEDEALVTLDGDSQQQVACSQGHFSFTVGATTDGLKNLLISQTDLAGNTSPQANQIWIRDTVAPLQVTLQNPTTNPFTSGDTFLALTGTCETGATVALITLPANSSTTLPCSPTGSFSFPISQPGNGIYSYVLKQQDVAGNASADLTFEWTVDMTIPSTPIILSPNISPVYTNTRTLTLNLSCSTFSPLPGELALSGDIVSSEVTSPAGSLTAPCSGNAAQFQLNKTADGSFSILVDQTNPNTGISSAPASLLWIVDTVAPSAPVLISPTTNPFVAPGDLNIQGTCETGTTLKLEGAVQQTETCTNGTFHWTITHLLDGEYDFQISQTDLALNVSPVVNLHWTRDINAVSPPVIQIPSSNPYTSNQTTLTLSGSCGAGNLITLSGAQSGTTVCGSGGGFSFTLAPGSDGTRTYSLTQTLNGVESSPVEFQWTRDTVAPLVQITANPPAINYSNNSTFSFIANETVSGFECKLDTGAFGSCSSPRTLAIANGMHTYSIRATDLAGNISLAQSVTWEQKAHNTIALYHFDSSGTLTTDSGNYLNHLSNASSVASTTSGQFSGGAVFPSSTPRFMNVSQNPTLDLGTANLTIEGFFKLNTLGTSGHYYTLVSKSISNTNLSYQVRLRRGSSSRYYIDFLTILNGATNVTTATSNILSTSSYMGTWAYFGIVYTQGKVSIFTGTNPGQATSGVIRTIGTTSSTLKTTNSELRLGFGVTATNARPLNGTLDEIRISQTVRNISVMPSAAFSPD